MNTLRFFPQHIYLIILHTLPLLERLDRLSRESGKTQTGQVSAAGEDSRTVVILELSGQVSMQEDSIVDLREQLEQRDQTISDLTHQLNQDTPQSRPVSQVSSRPPSGLTNRPSSGRSGQRTTEGDQRKGSGRSIGSKADMTSGINQSFDDILDSDDGQPFSPDLRLAKTTENGERTTRSDSARSTGKESSRDADSSLNQSKRESLSRERRPSGRQKERRKGDDAKSEQSLGRPKSSSHGDDPVEGGQRRKRSSSRGKRKETSSVKDLDNGAGTPPSLSTSHISSDFNGNESEKIITRISSAGSHDSAFHETTEEGTKSAPSSAGSSRSRRRLKAAQQRAVSLEVVNSNQSSPKPPSRTNLDLCERDSGVDDNCLKGSNKMAETSNHELDDLLQELLSDESPGDKSRGGHSAKHKFGISEDKIRSLFSDNTK